jgi:site-specific DNA recombinase
LPSTSPTSSPKNARSETDRHSRACIKRTEKRPAATEQRAVAYVRESTEEQGQGFSPDAQRQTIAKFAAENDLDLISEYCDFHSGWRKSEERPEFQRLMADAATGSFDVVLVFHTSRFERNQVESKRYKQLLRERLGIRVVSVTQPMGEDHTDPSSFLAESIHEMFDEYYSVSLSFWTRSGQREKARQGHLVGSLPWGYVRDPASKLAIPDPDRAPLVLEMFERYATSHESDRSLADWLNAKGARTARDRQFSKDTVREMLCNAAYAGYVSGLRDKTRAIQGLHEAIITDELFEKVQEIRSWRTRVVKPGRPSEDYLLRKLLCCERCGARMHGTRGSRAGVRRYQCSTRRHHGDCSQAIVKAEPLEDQLVAWLHAFQPDAKLRDLVLDTIRAGTQQHPGDDQKRRRGLLTQLDRLQDLYVLGDLTKPRYIMRRQTLEEELQRLAPPADPHLERQNPNHQRPA